MNVSQSSLPLLTRNCFSFFLSRWDRTWYGSVNVTAYRRLALYRPAGNAYRISDASETCSKRNSTARQWWNLSKTTTATVIALEKENLHSVQKTNCTRHPQLLTWSTMKTLQTFVVAIPKRVLSGRKDACVTTRPRGLTDVIWCAVTEGIQQVRVKWKKCVTVAFIGVVR